MLKQNVPIEGIILKSKLTILRFLNSSYEMELFNKSYEVISKVQERNPWTDSAEPDLRPN